MIRHAIKRKIWINHNIESWKDLLFYTFGQNKIPGYSKGLLGLNKAQDELILFFEENGYLPQYNDFKNIYGYIRRGDWLKFKISNWNDMMTRVFGRVNQPTSAVNKENFQIIGKKSIESVEIIQ